ncbi:MAG: hypothetical protein K8L99_20080, partial [Anaerolineae bacterium]|nr:hypothetical protein [Anaerolineae bacterium]
RLSAGRVQSVALRLVVEREREIDGFVSETYWTLRALLNADGVQFEAKLHRLKDTDVKFNAREQAEKLVGLLNDATFWVGRAGQTLKLRNPLPPFTTSALQQAAAKGLGLSPEKTMQLAQTLYEQGLITYHRTDGVSVATEAQTAAREIIQRDFGEAYLPPIPPTYQTKTANAQEAHEAIRPTDVARMPGDADGDGAKLYALIWKRFMASQMTPARYTLTAALIHAGKSRERPFPLVFKAQGRELLFDGFLRVYEEPNDVDVEGEDESGGVPTLKEGQALTLLELPIDEAQTRPPARFSEAALVGLRNGMYASLTAYIDHTGADLIVSQLGVEGLFSSNSAIPVSLHGELATRDDVVEVGHIVVADVIFTREGVKTPVLLVGYNIRTGIGGPWNIGAGRAVQSDDEILLDTWLAWRSEIALGDEIEVLGQHFTVVGLTRETSSWMSPYIFVSQQAAEDMLQLSGIASFYLLRLPPDADVTATAANIELQVGGVAALTTNEMAAADRRVMATVLDTPFNVMLLISAAIGIGVMGTITYSSILSRLLEYCVLKAMGGRNDWLQS